MGDRQGSPRCHRHGRACAVDARHASVLVGSPGPRKVSWSLGPLAAASRETRTHGSRSRASAGSHGTQTHGSRARALAVSHGTQTHGSHARASAGSHGTQTHGSHARASAVSHGTRAHGCRAVGCLFVCLGSMGTGGLHGNGEEVRRPGAGRPKKTNASPVRDSCFGCCGGAVDQATFAPVPACTATARKSGAPGRADPKKTNA
eukprot:9988111-Lingulodinium_polyedra.AAC.3